MTSVITSFYRNRAARSWRTTSSAGARAFHRTLPGYAPTRLVEAPVLADELGVGRVFVKEESSRLGLPAFKILGASYAVSRALSERFGAPGTVLGLDRLRTGVAAHGAVELVAATDGNHGRAVARTARLLGAAARIFLPTGITGQARSAIAGEGAEVVELPLAYDDVVMAAAAYAREAGHGAVLVQDTSWPGYHDVAGWIVDGYSTLFVEVDEQLAASGVVRPPDLVAVPVGVGSLAQAAVRHYRAGAVPAPVVLSVEPLAAPAVLASLHAGERMTVPTSATIMAGLNCGTPSQDAWPLLRAGLDAATAVTDDEAARAVHDLAALDVDAGPCGAAALAGVRDYLQAAPLPSDAVVLLLSTEGLTANPLVGER